MTELDQAMVGAAQRDAAHSAGYPDARADLLRLLPVARTEVTALRDGSSDEERRRLESLIVYYTELEAGIKGVAV
jgi:hypothetical protein